MAASPVPVGPLRAQFDRQGLRRDAGGRRHRDGAVGVGLRASGGVERHRRPLRRPSPVGLDPRPRSGAPGRDGSRTGVARRAVLRPVAGGRPRASASGPPRRRRDVPGLRGRRVPGLRVLRWSRRCRTRRVRPRRLRSSRCRPRRCRLRRQRAHGIGGTLVFEDPYGGRVGISAWTASTGWRTWCTAASPPTP